MSFFHPHLSFLPRGKKSWVPFQPFARGPSGLRGRGSPAECRGFDPVRWQGGCGAAQPKTVYLNLSQDGQLWAQACGLRCGRFRTGSQWDSWHSLASRTSSCIISVVQKRSGPGREWLVVACLLRTDWTLLIQPSTWLSAVVFLNDHWLLCLFVCWVTFQAKVHGGDCVRWILRRGSLVTQFKHFRKFNKSNSSHNRVGVYACHIFIWIEPFIKPG